MILGSSDWPPTEAGLEQARPLARTLVEKDIRLVLSSPLSRALATARILVKDAPVEPLAGLAELSRPGCLKARREPRSCRAAGTSDPARTTGRPAANPTATPVPRVAAALDRVLEAARLGPVLVVGHSVVNRLLLALYWRQPVDALMGFTQPHDVILVLGSGQSAWFDADGRSGTGLPRPRGGETGLDRKR